MMLRRLAMVTGFIDSIASLATAATSVLGHVTGASPAKARQLSENLRQMQNNDDAMDYAMANARATFDVFARQTMCNAASGDDAFVKVGLLTPEDSIEHIWIYGVRPNGQNSYTGSMANEPHDLPTLAINSAVTFTSDMISDWMVMIDGLSYGNFSTRAMIPTMEQDLADATRSALSDAPIPARWVH